MKQTPEDWVTLTKRVAKERPVRRRLMVYVNGTLSRPGRRKLPLMLWNIVQY